MKTPDVIRWGKGNGEGMIVRYQTRKGTNVFGLAVPNVYARADWDLGPTWCYLIIGNNTTLIDTGRFGNFEFFRDLMRSVEKDLSDIEKIIITHGHEDHDGNLAEVYAGALQAKLVAHSIYPKMIVPYPEIADGATHPQLPGSCRLCVMPESFFQQMYALSGKEKSD